MRHHWLKEAKVAAGPEGAVTQRSSANEAGRVIQSIVISSQLPQARRGTASQKLLALVKQNTPVRLF